MNFTDLKVVGAIRIESKNKIPRQRELCPTSKGYHALAEATARKSLPQFRRNLWTNLCIETLNCQFSQVMALSHA